MPITDFLAQISAAGGLARPNRFAVELVPPKIFANSALNATRPMLDQISARGIGALASLRGEPPQNYGLRPDYFQELQVDTMDMQSRLDFLCQEAELPGKSFGTTDAKTYGSTFKMPYVDIYQDITLQFIVGKDMAEKHFFDAWQYTIQDPETADFNYVDEYATTIDIYQLDEQDVPTYGCRLYQTWPVSLGQLTLSYDARNTYHVLPVTFTYRKWINMRINSGTPTAIDPAGGAPTNFESTIATSKNTKQ